MKKISAIVLVCEFVSLFLCNPLWANEATVQQPTQAPNGAVTNPSSVRGDSISNPILMLLERNPRLKAQIKTIQASGKPASNPALLSSGAVFTVRPNPGKDNVQITFRLAKPGQVAFTVYDATGKTVREIVYTNQPPGLHRVIWDGKGTNGKIVTAGGYSLKMTSPDGVKTAQFSYSR